MGMEVVRIKKLTNSRDRELLSAFIPIYIENFPIADQREDPSEWIDNLSSSHPTSSSPRICVLVIGDNLVEGSDPCVYGGIVIEYYRRSQAGLLTYCAVKEDQRGKGYAKALLAGAIDVLKEEAATSGVPLSAVFAEVKNIYRDSAQKDAMPPDVRLEILSKMGAKWLDIRYVQPPLKEGLQRVHNLLLVCFPFATGLSGCINTSIVRDFLLEFYNSLGIHDPASDMDFQELEKNMQEDNLRLKELPVVERPILKIENVCICLHCVQDPEKERISIRHEEATDYGRLKLKSFELDLLASRFQSAPPFYSRCITESKTEILIHYPELLEYESEGRCITLVPTGKCQAKKAYAILSQTYFPESHVTVFHLALHPIKGEYFTEYDLIKLSKTHSGIQEGDKLSENIRFSLLKGNQERHSLTELISILMNNQLESSITPRAGTIEIDVSSIKSSFDVRHLLKLVGRTYSNETINTEYLEELFRSFNSQGLVIKALCGIITSILDFERMCFEEVVDTLEPTVICNTSMVRIHRNNLVSLAEDDEILEYCWDTVGISPYLIIPQAIMLQNDVVIDLAEKKMISVIYKKNRMPIKNSYRDYLVWSRIREEAERHIKLEQIGNVFQYSTERKILEKGIRHRGSDQKRNIVGARLAELTMQVESFREKLRQKSEINKSLLLGLLAGMSLRPLLFAIFDDWIGGVPIYKYRLAWYAFLFFFGCFIGFLLRTIRSAKTYLK